jgi:hypothetical protein
MAKQLLVLFIGAAALVLAAITLPHSVSGAPPSSATVIFGHERIGSTGPCGPHAPQCPPGRGVGQSAEAVDALVPRTVVIADEGTVFFDNSGPPHRVGVCQAGLEADDLSLAAVGNVMTDPRCVHHAPGADVTWTFTEPGKYLIICSFLPHFRDREMYGRVIVQ